jgi:hypothetical protein
MPLTQRLLLQNKEDGVNELDVFDVVIDHVVGNQTLSDQLASLSDNCCTYGSEHLGAAHGVVCSVFQVKRDTAE